MSDAQEYVNALREGNYCKALELASYIIQKYEPMKKNLGADELVQLGGYELGKTDINEKDITLIRFLYNYFQYHAPLANGEIGYTLITFLALINVVLSIRKDQEFKTIIDLVSITDKTQFLNFLEDTSNFSILVERNINQFEWMAALTASMDETVLLERIATMDNPTFTNFHRDIQQLQQKLETEGIEFFCPLVKCVEKAKALKETAAIFKLRLQNKLIKEGIRVTEEEVISPEEPTLKQQKLINRYHAVHALCQELQGKIVFDETDKEMIDGVIEICYHNEADWNERYFTQKFTDILSIGLKPLYRTFFSKETAFKQKIEGVVQELPLRSN